MGPEVGIGPGQESSVGQNAFSTAHNKWTVKVFFMGADLGFYSPVAEPELERLIGGIYGGGPPEGGEQGR